MAFFRRIGGGFGVAVALAALSAGLWLLGVITGSGTEPIMARVPRGGQIALAAPVAHALATLAPDSIYLCGSRALTLEAIGASRGLTREQVGKLLAIGFTPDAICSARESIIQSGLRKADGPKPSFPGEYLRWRNLSLTDEHGSIDPDGLMRAKAHLDAMRAMQPDVPSAAGIRRDTWVSIGPGNVGGRIRTIVIDPRDANTMFVGSVSGGIWKTTNGGTSWAAVDDFMANLAVSSLVMQPGNPDVIYAGTGEGFFNGDGLRGAGVFKSSNGGTTWTQLAATSTSPSTGIETRDFYYVNRLAMSANGSVLLAATRRGIFRSVDGGTTFTRATAASGGAIGCSPDTSGIVDVDFHPIDSSKAIAGTYCGTALYSTDGGSTWREAAGLPGGSTFRRVETAFAPSAGNIVYASVDYQAGTLYKSTDAGLTFSVALDGANDSINPFGSVAQQGWYDNLLWVSPTDSNLVIWGGIDNWRSTDGGATFAKISQWFSHDFSNPTSAHADQHIAVAHPAYNGSTNRIVFFGTDGGVYRAADVTTVGGGSLYQTGWTELNNGLAITQFYGAAGHPGTGRITGGTQDNGTIFYNPSLANASESWTESFSGDGGFSAYDASDANYFYGEYVYLQIHRNSSGGASGSNYIYGGSTTIPRLSDAGSSANAEFIAAFIRDPNENRRLLGAAIRLWRTNDARASIPAWEIIKDGLGFGDKISAIAVAPGDSNIIYAGHNAGRLYKTTTGTSDAATVRASWTTIDDNAAANPLPNRRITRVTVDPSNSNTVYVAFGGFSPDNVYKSSDGGATWRDISGPSGGATALPEVPVRDLEVHPSNGNWLYAATEVGIFTSENGGSTWSIPHDGPSNVSVDELFFLNTDLYAATHGRGVFKTATSFAAPTAVNDSYSVNLNTTLTVTAASGVLANDTSNGGGAMTAALVSNVSRGTLALGADGSFVYTPATDYSGTDSFTYRASNPIGPSSVATVTITIVPRVGTPAGFTADVNGNALTFRWTATPGVLVTDGYEIMVGVSPGGTVTTLSVGSATSYSIPAAPDGVYYARIRARSGAPAFYSAVSSEITVRIGSAAVPGAPSNLLATASGSTVSLAWMRSSLGGTLATYQVQASSVAGGVPFATLNVAPSQTLVSVPGVPTGTYFLRVVAIGPAGLTSAASNEVPVIVPGGCIAPLSVQNLRSEVAGSAVTIRWDLPSMGFAPTAFRLEAGLSSGAANAAVVQTTDMTLAATAPPGTYFVRVYALNACGASSPSPELRVVVP